MSNDNTFNIFKLISSKPDAGVIPSLTARSELCSTAAETPCFKAPEPRKLYVNPIPILQTIDHTVAETSTKIQPPCEKQGTANLQEEFSVLCDPTSLQTPVVNAAASSQTMDVHPAPEPPVLQPRRVSVSLFKFSYFVKIYFQFFTVHNKREAISYFVSNKATVHFIA